MSDEAKPVTLVVNIDGSIFDQESARDAVMAALENARARGPLPVETRPLEFDSDDSPPERPTLWQRLRLAWLVLRGRA